MNESPLWLIALIPLVIFFASNYSSEPHVPYEPCSYINTGTWLSDSEYDECIQSVIDDAYDSYEMGTNG